MDPGFIATLQKTDLGTRNGKKAMNEQTTIQHALKYLAECEYEQTGASLEKLAGQLELPPSETEKVLRDLRSADLVAADGFHLTATGREYAMHVLQAHRLYETYLARKTSVPESAWHELAHVKEHELSESDVRRLADELGHPRYDPHGDPIPTITGEMPPKRGKLLTEYSAGWAGRVVHVEDEPPRLYARIAEAGIAPDTVLRVERTDPDGMTIRVEGRTFSFPRNVIEKITVVELAKGEAFDESLERLTSLRPGERGSVVGLSPLCRGLERNRLLDLGIVPGTIVTVEMVNPSGSPTAYRVRGACIALRREQAERIRIRKVSS